MASAATQVVWTKSGEAQNYTNSRPEHPPDVVNICLEYLRTNYEGPLSCAMDIGCGTGHSTEHLLPHFEKVYGCDPSQAMLDQATENYKNHDNVEFLQANAEDLSQFPESSFQLVIASRCIHYFDSKKFFEEVDRILSPNGILVFYTVQFEVLNSITNPDLTTALTNAYDQYLEDWVGDYWCQPKYLPDGFKYKARNRKIYYTEILQPPYPKEKKIATFETHRTIDLKKLRSLLVSYSASVRFREANGDEKADTLLDKCMNTIKDILPEGKGESTVESVPVKATNEFFMVLCRKPSE